MMKPLTARQQRFVAAYLDDMSASRAAQLCGYHPRSIGRMMARPHIQAAIAVGARLRQPWQSLDADDILREIARLACADPRQLFDTEGRLLPVCDWPAHAAATVAAYKVRETRNASGQVTGETREVRFWDKGRQLELAVRYLGLLHEQPALDAVLPQLIRAGRARLTPPAADAEFTSADASGDMPGDIPEDTPKAAP